MTNSRSCILILVLLMIAVCASAVFGANDRPMIFGQNPVPTDWWGYDPYTYDPVEFNRMMQAGTASCRIGVNWDVIEPTRGVRNWSEIDRWVRYAIDRGINPVLLINSTPTWALPYDVNPEITSPEARYPAREDCLDDFNSFVYELARRYRGRVQYYEYWNEANGYGWHWDEGFNRADEYTPWMKRAYIQVKLANPIALMSTTGIDDNGGGGDYFLQLLYNYGAKGYFDAVADHPYSPAQIEEWKLNDIRDLLDTNGDQHVKIWITEMGWPADGRESTVAGYITDYFDKLVANHPTVTMASYHTAMDFPWENVGYGLIDRYFNPKVTYYAFSDYPKPTRPVISNITLTRLTPSSVRVDFTTDIAARSLVMYGLTDTYGMVTGKEIMPTTSHSFTINGLNPGTGYHYRIRTGALDYGDIYSSDRTFTTLSGSVVNITSGPAVSGITDSSATITWTTDVPSTSEVQYGIDFSYGGSASSATPTTSHSVLVTGLQPGTTYQYRAISTASGYGDASEEGNPFTTLSTFGELQNGSFEHGSMGWTVWDLYPWGHDGDSDGNPDNPGTISVYTNNGGAYPPTPATKDGSYRLTHDRGWASACGGLYQAVNVQNGIYVVSGWVAAGCDGGDEVIELIAVDGEYTGGVPTGTSIAHLTTSSPWTYYSTPVAITGGKITIATRVSQWMAADIVAGHFDGITLSPATPVSISEFKATASSDYRVTNTPKVVTAVINDYDFYIQEDDRSCGIMVHTTSPHGLSIGDRASVVGKLLVVQGEAAISSAMILDVTTGTEPDPLGMPNRSIGGAQSGLQPAVGAGTGLNNVGLLVKTWGAYTKLSDTAFTVDDGSGTPIRCEVPTGVTLPTTGGCATVIGISSCYQNGAIEPRIRVRRAGDIVHNP